MALFSSALRSLPRFSALAGSLLSQVNDLLAVIAALPAAFSVSGAAGVQLDDIGVSILYPRPEGMNDADYRACLTAKFSLFTWDGSNGSAQAILSRIFPGSTFCDNCDGTVSVHPVSSLQAEQKLYPLPAGVRTIVS